MENLSARYLAAKRALENDYFTSEQATGQMIHVTLGLSGPLSEREDQKALSVVGDFMDAFMEKQEVDYPRNVVMMAAEVGDAGDVDPLQSIVRAQVRKQQDIFLARWSVAVIFAGYTSIPVEEALEEMSQSDDQHVRQQAEDLLRQLRLAQAFDEMKVQFGENDEIKEDSPNPALVAAVCKVDRLWWDVVGTIAERIGQVMSGAVNPLDRERMEAWAKIQHDPRVKPVVDAAWSVMQGREAEVRKRVLQTGQ